MSSQRQRILAALGVLVVLAWPAGAHAIDDVADFNLFFGKKYLGNDWDLPTVDFTTQTNYGILGSWGLADWPARFALDYVKSYEEESFPGDVTTSATTREIGFGARTFLYQKRTLVYVGGGVAHVRGGFRTVAPGDVDLDRDSSFGFWVDGGIFWRVLPFLNVGIAGRFSRASILDGVQAGGAHVGVTVGYGWGRSGEQD